jgi:ribose transport system permease protein
MKRNTPTMNAALQRLDRAHLIVIGLSLALMAVGVVMNEAFATRGNFANLLEQSVAVGLVSLGQTLVVLAGGIDLAVGALVSALGVMFAWLCERSPEHAPWFLLLTLLAGIAVGTLNAALILWLRLHSLVVTIGMAALLSGATLTVARQPVGSAPPWVQEIAYGDLAGLSYAGLVMLACFAATGWGLRQTRGGLHLLACGGNPEGARLAGLGGARSTLAGEPLTLASITPVVIGGTLLGGGKGGVLGTLLGVFLLVLLGNVLNYMNVSTFLQWTIQGFIIIAAVFFQSGKKELRA